MELRNSGKMFENSYNAMEGKKPSGPMHDANAKK